MVHTHSNGQEGITPPHDAHMYACPCGAVCEVNVTRCNKYNYMHNHSTYTMQRVLCI